MITELTKSLKSYFYERTTSSLLGSFIVFWVVFNWKIVLLILYGVDDINIRISEIEENYINIYANYICPISSAIAYSIFYPYISVIPYSLSKHANGIKIRIRNKIESIVTISRDEFIALKREILDKEEECSKNITRKTLHEEALGNEVASYKKQLDSANDDLNSVKQDYQSLINMTGSHDEALYKIVVKTLNSLKKITSHDYSGNIYSFSKALAQLSNEKTWEFDDFQTNNQWLHNISLRADKRIMNNMVDEISDYIRRLLSASERIRIEFKTIVKRRRDNPGLEDVKFSWDKINNLTEEWDNARTAVNDVVSTWKDFVISQEHLTKEEKANIWFEFLKPIQH